MKYALRNMQVCIKNDKYAQKNALKNVDVPMHLLKKKKTIKYAFIT